MSPWEENKSVLTTRVWCPRCKQSKFISVTRMLALPVVKEDVCDKCAFPFKIRMTYVGAEAFV